jgi:hypothetical protein
VTDLKFVAYEIEDHCFLIPSSCVDASLFDLLPGLIDMIPALSFQTFYSNTEDIPRVPIQFTAYH